MGNRTMRNRISIYRKLTRLGAWLASGLLVGQCVLVLVSWLQTAAMPETFPRTLLNAEGIRWFFGRFTENLMQPMLVWLLLLCISLGALYRSGLLHFNGREYRQRVAMSRTGAETLAGFLQQHPGRCLSGSCSTARASRGHQPRNFESPPGYASASLNYPWDIFPLECGTHQAGYHAPRWQSSL